MKHTIMRDLLSAAGLLLFASCAQSTPTPAPAPEPGNEPDVPGAVASPKQQYVVLSGTGEKTGVYLQLAPDPLKGSIDPMNPEGRLFFSASTTDFVNWNNDILIGMAYPSKGGSTSDYITRAWKLVDGKLEAHGQGVSLDGDVKARGLFSHYLLGTSLQNADGRHYLRVKYIDLDTFSEAVWDGKLYTDLSDREPASMMDGEAWDISDMEPFGDYVLASFTTQQKDPIPGATGKASYGTELANNFYMGVFKFDPKDPDKEYLKIQNTIVRKSEDHPGKPAGQIIGNNNSRRETGIEVIGNEIYLFVQGTKTNIGETVPEVPSAVLRISGDNIKDGKPAAIDDDYYFDLTAATGYYFWRSYNLGNGKVCLQFFTAPDNTGLKEKSHKVFFIYDVHTQSLTPVTGLPDPAEIKDIALAYALDSEAHTVTFEIETTDERLPALYTIDSDGKALRGTEVSSEVITGVSLLKDQK